MASTPTLADFAPHFPHWQKIGDLIDQCIDLMLNLRQSGHPGGSRSKVPLLVATTLGPGMRWDIRRPQAPFADRFVLVAGHCNPAVYAMLAVYNEALRARYERTGDPRYLVDRPAEYALTWEHLLELRRHGGLPGHAEMEGRTLFFKFNTGPSGHGAPAALGAAFALKHAGAEDVRVFALEGEGGLTAGAHHEVKNSAWGLGCANLIYLVDWNDYGIDPRAHSSVVYGEPKDWFEPHGWRVAGTEAGEDYAAITEALLAIVQDPTPGDRPGCVYVKTRKGRGYHLFDAPSHGKAHARNAAAFWRGRAEFAARYGVQFVDAGNETDPGDAAARTQTEQWLRTVMQVLRDDPALVDYLSDRLVALGDAVPQSRGAVRSAVRRNLAEDRSWLAPERLPASLFVAPGTRIANKEGLAKFGAWVNSVAREELGRPLMLACSADLAESTSIAGFAQAHRDASGSNTPGYGWYERTHNPTGALLPQQITEFANAGIMAGIATVNFAAEPEQEFLGYWGAHSTYGSFAYLQYGPMRLFSQLAQDCPLKVGKVLWVAGHSGPETAEDSRTHFGIYEPAIGQSFPDGQVINLHPWEHNEVPVMLAAALATDVPIVVLHLTRPPVAVPDRAALGCAPYQDAARGAYLLRDYDPGQPREGCLFVQGTSATKSVVELLGRWRERGCPNVKLVAATSYELFRRQDEAYRQRIASRADWLDSTVISSAGRRTMHDWLAHKQAGDYALTSDWDDRWRTGGSVVEIETEAHLDPDNLLAGIRRFAAARAERLRQLTPSI